MAADIVTVLLW